MTCISPRVIIRGPIGGKTGNDRTSEVTKETKVDKPEGERLVYVQRTVMTLGTGGTSRNATSENFYEAFPQEDGTVKLVLLDINDQHSVLTEIVDPDELAREYEPVPGYFEKKESAKQKEIAKKLATGKQHLKREEYYSAEFEFDGVIDLDERNLEAHVAKSEALLAQGDVEAARVTLEKVSEFEELYDKDNKHIFNSFGMNLRRGGFYDKAVESYAKALRMDPTDENLFYNIGRASYDKKDHEKALLFLRKCLELNPRHQDAALLIKRIRQDMDNDAGRK